MGGKIIEEKKKVSKEDISYCGLNCQNCQLKFKKVQISALNLQSDLEAMNFKEMAKVIPFMKHKYKNHQKMMKFFMEGDCPGCRENGGNPFCSIRKCARKRGYFTCAECKEEYPCKKFDMLFRVHSDDEIQNRMAELQNISIDAYIAKI